MCNLCRRECRVEALKWHKCSGWLGHGCRVVVAVVTRERAAENAKTNANAIHHSPQEAAHRHRGRGENTGVETGCFQGDAPIMGW